MQRHRGQARDATQAFRDPCRMTVSPRPMMSHQHRSECKEWLGCVVVHAAGMCSNRYGGQVGPAAKRTYSGTANVSDAKGSPMGAGGGGFHVRGQAHTTASTQIGHASSHTEIARVPRRSVPVFGSSGERLCLRALIHLRPETSRRGFLLVSHNATSIC